MLRWVCASAVAVVVARRGLKKGSLSRSGALAALVVGTVALGSAAFTGAVLLAFYFSGSAATRVKQDVKAKLDLEHRSGGGQRNWQQVLATAGIGCLLLAPVVLRADAGPLLGWPLPSSATSTTTAILLPAGGAAKLGAGVLPDLAAAGFSLAAIIAALQGPPGELLVGLCLVAYVASFATVAGDTWASELGVLSSRPPILLVDIFCGRPCAPRRVPRGTNGGVSVWGTVMSAAGGAFVGAIAFLVLALQAVLGAAVSGGSGNAVAAAAADLFALRPQLVAGGSALVLPPLWLLPLSCFAGLVGSLIDSIAGALLQRSWVQRGSGKATSRLPPGAEVLCDKDGNALRLSDSEMEQLAQAPFAAAVLAERKKEGAAVHPADTTKSTAVAADADHDGVRQRKAPGVSANNAGVAAAEAVSNADGFLVVCGHDIVSNEAVNFISSAATAVLTAWVTTLAAQSASAHAGH